MPQRIYIVGAGVIARAHARAARELPDVALHAADPNPEALAQFARQFPEAATYSDADAMLAPMAAENDIVVVAVPPWLHAPLTVKAFASGRHVLCEKPLGRDLGELHAMIEASHRAGRKLGDCSVRMLGLPQLDRVREMIASGELGRLYHGTLIYRRARDRPGIEYQPESPWFLDRAKSGGGVLLDWGVYDVTTFFDVVRPVRAEIRHAWLAAPVTANDPRGTLVEMESHAGASLVLTLENGDTINLTYERGNGLHGAERDIMELEGDKGGVAWNWIPYLAPERTMVVTQHTDMAGKLIEVSEKFVIGERDVWNTRPLHSFATFVQGGDSVALPENRLVFNFACVAALYEVAATGRPKVIELAA